MYDKMGVFRSNNIYKWPGWVVLARPIEEGH